jgi:hypothetical protein
VAIVSLTITEKGYCIDPASGMLDLTQPRIIHDLQNPALPQSVPGILVEASPAAANEACRRLRFSPAIIFLITVTWSKMRFWAWRKNAPPNWRSGSLNTSVFPAPWLTVSCPPPPMSRWLKSAPHSA